MIHRPRKRFGQHFLHDPAVVARVIEAINPQPGDCLVEVGPGRGVLTGPLLERAEKLIAIEIDRDLVRDLHDRYAGKGEFNLHNADALKFDYRSPGRKLRLVGNLPYNISTPLLFRFVEQRDSICDMHFMLQKEVVDRMTATTNTRAYGRLTVMLAPYFEIERLFDVGTGAFTPPPRVSSSFVRLTPRGDSYFANVDKSAYAAVVAEAFSHRRKTIRNALRRIISEEQIRAAQVEPAARPETLEPGDFANLSQQVTSDNSGGRM